jgi:hypothetical protein
MATLNPLSCNSVLGQLTAYANNTTSPQPLYPIFMASFACGANIPADYPRTNLTYQSYSELVSFPNVNMIRFCPADSDTTTYANAQPAQNKPHNCLRVINFNPLDVSHENIKLTPNQVNVLPQAYDSQTSGVPYNILWLDASKKPLNQTFDLALKSWFIPPNFQAVFFSKNPVNVKPSEAGPYLFADSGTLVTDAWSQRLTLTDNQTLFLSNVNGRAVVNAPYMVVIQKYSFDDTLLNMCTNSIPTYLGNTGNSLNVIWTPQTSGCDSLLTSVCKARHASIEAGNHLDDQYTDLCNCFDQQDALNQKFGLDRRVSCLCFGHLVTNPPNDFEKSCSTNPDSYKTKDMQNSVCTVGTCQQIQSNFIVAPGAQPPSCNAGGVILPGASNLQGAALVSDTNSSTPDAQVVTETNIPIWAHLMAGLSGALLLTLIILLIYW